MEIDYGSLWTWTLPLWGLFVIILFLGGVIMKPVILEGIVTSVSSVETALSGDIEMGKVIEKEAGAPMIGGGKTKRKSVRFAL